MGAVVLGECPPRLHERRRHAERAVGAPLDDPGASDFATLAEALPPPLLRKLPGHPPLGKPEGGVSAPLPQELAIDGRCELASYLAGIAPDEGAAVEVNVDAASGVPAPGR